MSGPLVGHVPGAASQHEPLCKREAEVGEEQEQEEAQHAARQDGAGLVHMQATKKGKKMWVRPTKKQLRCRKKCRSRGHCASRIK